MRLVVLFRSSEDRNCVFDVYCVCRHRVLECINAGRVETHGSLGLIEAYILKIYMYTFQEHQLAASSNLLSLRNRLLSCFEQS